MALSLLGIQHNSVSLFEISWCNPYSPGSTYVKDHEAFFRHNWDFLVPTKRSGEILQKGNYEWPFEHVMPGNSAESIEGLDDCWVIYRMKAKIERGILQHNQVARKHVRLIRTLDPSAPELSSELVGLLIPKDMKFSIDKPQSVENVWPGKISYSFSTPTKGVIFGTSVKVNFKFIPLMKGLEIGQITTELYQTQEMKIPTSKEPKRHTISREIVRDKWKLPASRFTEDIDGQEGYLAHRIIQLPKAMKYCAQTANSMGIKITHRLYFSVELVNPDGHVSQLHATIPIVIFISPHLPPDENNNIIHQPNMSTASAPFANLAPPGYGEHQFDQLYGEIDLGGFITPAGGASGIGTPFASQSRSGSSEDLASMDAVTAFDFTANVLQAHLPGLENPASGRMARDRPNHPPSLADETIESNQVSSRDQGPPQSRQNIAPMSEHVGNIRGRPRSSPLSRRTSAGEPTTTENHTPQHIEFCAEYLAKVPSYSTAVQSRATAPINDGLPNYQAATQVQSSLPQAPDAVHIRGSS